MTTDKNMSVFGIDELFIDVKKKMILFGESKISKSIDNGISLINKSLGGYEAQIRDEFMLVLSNDMIKKNGLTEIFGEKHEVCLSFDEFIKETKMESIGVPLFIAHGKETNTEDIINKLESKIKKKQLFNLNTEYYVVSLPIIDKDEFLRFLTLEIKNKLEEYSESR